MEQHECDDLGCRSTFGTAYDLKVHVNHHLGTSTATTEARKVQKTLTRHKHINHGILTERFKKIAEHEEPIICNDCGKV